MNNWKEGKLSDIAIVIMGQSPQGETCNNSGNGTPLLNGPTEFGIRFPKPVQYTTDPRKISEIGDILFCVRGSTTGRMNWANQNFAIGRGLAAIRHKKGSNYQYFVRGVLDFHLPSLLQGASGSTFPNVSGSELGALPILIPNETEQKSISETLSSLDDKIDLLHRQNNTLSQLAETLFRQLFVVEIKEEWKHEPLGNYVQIKRGGSPRPIHDYISETGLNWLKISDVTGVDSPYIFEIKEKIKQEGLSKTTLLKKGSLILSNSATPGIPKILDVDSCIHDGWLHFPKSKFTNEFLYLFFKSIRPELLQLGNGSIFTNLKTDILKEYVLPIPDDGTLTDFDSQVKPIFNKLYSNTTQIRTLTNLRDALLPKLMNGEVSVEN